MLDEKRVSRKTGWCLVVCIRHTCRRSGQPTRDAANLGDLVADGNTNTATGTAAATKRNAIDSPNAAGRVSDCSRVRINAGGDGVMRRQRTRDEIERLADRQQMLCDFAKLALGQRDRVAAAMLVKDAMLVDAEIRQQVYRLGPVELTGRT